MAIAISNITLCKVPFSPTNQIDFTSVEKQREYFNNLPNNRVYRNYSFVKREQKLKVRGYVEREFDLYNYCFYENKYGDSTRRYYCWIVSKRYLAKNTTELTIVIDAFQTFLFEWSFRQSFIERETPYNDSFGHHTIPEDVELGDYVTTKQMEISEMKGNLAFFMAITDYNTKSIGSIFGKMYNGYALKYYEKSDIAKMTNDIIQLSEEGKADSILFIFSFPQRFFTQWCEEQGIKKPSSDTFITGIDAFLRISKNFKTSDSELLNFSDNGKAYNAENKKMGCYPFTFIEITAPNGSNVVLKYENFSNPHSIDFSVDSTISPNPTFSCTPRNYGNENFSLADSIETSGYGLCSWNNDAYANWFANNQIVLKAQSENAWINYKTASTVSKNSATTSRLNNADTANAGYANTAIDVMGQIGNLNVAGAVATGGKGIINTSTAYDISSRNTQNDYMNSQLMNWSTYQNEINSITASIQQASVQPNQCKGDTSSTNLDVSRETCTFLIKTKKIKSEYAKVIDRKMKMYGYKVSKVGLPSIKNRSVFDYVKTVGCQIVGQLRQEDKEMIESMFDNGLRVWHNPDNLYNYDLKNTPIGG